MTKDLNAKLTAVEASLKRWHTRLTRASRMLQKLEKQRRRLATQVAYISPAPGRVKAAEPKPKIVTDSAIPLPELDAFFLPTKPKPLVHHDDLAAMPSNVKAPENLDLPTFLDRRKVKVDKKAMPLTGRAAQEAIRPKRKKATV